MHLATNTGIAPEAVIDGGERPCCSSKDSQALAQRIKELLSDLEEAEQLGNRSEKG